MRLLGKLGGVGMKLRQQGASQRKGNQINVSNKASIP